MKCLGDILSEEEIPSVIADLEEISDEAPRRSVAAIYVLKNELGELDFESKSRLEYNRIFSLPRDRKLLPDELGPGAVWKRGKELATDFRLWLKGTDAERFRDRCDHDYFERVVPEIVDNFGALADPLINTVNEAVINYAEYSFAPRSRRRQVQLHLFRTDGKLGYAIIRPLGSRIKTFDPLRLKTKQMTTLREARRGWGYTLIMERALFVSFDQQAERRGMMIIVGSDDPREAAG